MTAEEEGRKKKKEMKKKGWWKEGYRVIMFHWPTNMQIKTTKLCFSPWTCVSKVDPISLLSVSVVRQASGWQRHEPGNVLEQRLRKDPSQSGCWHHLTGSCYRKQHTWHLSLHIQIPTYRFCTVTPQPSTACRRADGNQSYFFFAGVNYSAYLQFTVVLMIDIFVFLYFEIFNACMFGLFW